MRRAAVVAVQVRRCSWRSRLSCKANKYLEGSSRPETSAPDVLWRHEGKEAPEAAATSREQTVGHHEMGMSQKAFWPQVAPTKSQMTNGFSRMSHTAQRTHRHCDAERRHLSRTHRPAPPPGRSSASSSKNTES